MRHSNRKCFYSDIVLTNTLGSLDIFITLQIPLKYIKISGNSLEYKLCFDDNSVDFILNQYQ